MKGIWNWASSTVTAIGSGVNKAVSVLGSTAQIVKNVYHYLSSPVSGFALQTLKGFFNYWQPSVIISLFEPNKTKPIVWKALSANMGYMAMALMLEGGRKYLPRVIPQMENPVAEWGIDAVLYAVNAVALVYMLQKASAMYVDNTFNNVAISKVVCDENPSTNHGKACDHGYTAQFQAGCASTFYYMGNIGTVMIAELAAGKYIPVIGEYAAWPLRAFAYGQALVEYKLSCIGNCTPCRYEKLSANNGYSFGMGLAFYGLYDGLKTILYRYYGFENAFLADAIFNVFFQYSILTAIMNDKPLPGKTPGLDVFLPSRIAVEAWLTRASTYLVALYSNPEQNIDIKKQIQQVADCPPVYAARKTLLDANIQSEEIVARPSFSRAYFLYEKQVQDFLDWLKEIRKDPIKNKLPLFTDYIPDLIISPYTKNQINLAFDKRWDDVIIILNDFMRFVRSKNGKKFLKTYNTAMMNQALEQHEVKPAAPLAIELKNPEDTKAAIKIEPDTYLVPEPQQVIVAPKTDIARPGRRVKVDKFFTEGEDNEKQDKPKQGLPPGGVRLSSSGLFRRNSLTASSQQGQLYASKGSSK
jgi:hypothetical protein